LAAIDYYGIETAIKSILEADATLAAKTGFNVQIEKEIWLGSDGAPAVYIYLEDRSADVEQYLARATRQRYNLRLSLWCVEFHQDNLSEAAKYRDELMGQVESALLAQTDRTFSGKVQMWWFDGGEFASFTPDQGFLSSGQIIINAVAEMTT